MNGAEASSSGPLESLSCRTCVTLVPASKMILPRLQRLLPATALLLTLLSGCSRHYWIPNQDALASKSLTASGLGADRACANDSSGGMIFGQRLGKLEYNNVIRDLFGVDQDFSAQFSADSTGTAGFTTESEAQNLSSQVVSDFWNASGAVADAVFASTPNPILSCTAGEACARQIIITVTNRAFRRPASPDEVEDLLVVFRGASSGQFTYAMKLVTRAILVSPQFLFRTYDLPASGAPQVALTDHELASRLSFFIWGSIPDQPLLDDAAKGQLQANQQVLASHARRMLADPRATYLARNFGSQWLLLQKFDATVLNTARFPTWSDSLKASMKNETLAFLDHILLKDQSVVDFVAGKYSFLDGNMSKNYGIPLPPGSDPAKFNKVDLNGQRVGILTQSTILAMTSGGDRTSPVRRGNWLLDRILCSAPPPPPADIPPLPPPANQTDLQAESRIRQRFEQHIQIGSTCKGCHVSMDAVGYAFENYDSAGIYRPAYIDGKPVDAADQLPTGQKFKNFIDLAGIVAAGDQFPRCFASKLSSFAEGRDLSKPADACTVSGLAAQIGPQRKFSDLVAAIVQSTSFRRRQVSY